MPGRNQIKALLFAAGTLSILVTAAIWLELAVFDFGAGEYLEKGVLTDAQKKSIDTFLLLTQLFIGWSVAVIGAATLLVRERSKMNALKQIDAIFAFVSMLFGISSIFFGHLIFDKTVEALSLEQFPVTNYDIRSLARYQYICSLFAFSTFGLNVFSCYWPNSGSNSS